MKLRPFKGNLALRFGITLFVIGALALLLLLVYNHGLEDTFPLILYTIAYVAISVGLLLCLVGVAINLVRHRSAE
jgi:hypothetical protein